MMNVRIGPILCHPYSPPIFATIGGIMLAIKAK